MWKYILVHFSFNKISSPSQAVQDHQKWFHINLTHGFNSSHVFFLAAFIILLWLICKNAIHQINGWYLPLSLSGIPYFGSGSQWLTIWFSTAFLSPFLAPSSVMLFPFDWKTHKPLLIVYVMKQLFFSNFGQTKNSWDTQDYVLHCDNNHLHSGSDIFDFIVIHSALVPLSRLQLLLQTCFYPEFYNTKILTPREYSLSWSIWKVCDMDWCSQSQISNVVTILHHMRSADFEMTVLA